MTTNRQDLVFRLHLDKASMDGYPVLHGRGGVLPELRVPDRHSPDHWEEHGKPVLVQQVRLNFSVHFLSRPFSGLIMFSNSFWA